MLHCHLKTLSRQSVSALIKRPAPRTHNHYDPSPNFSKIRQSVYSAIDSASFCGPFYGGMLSRLVVRVE